MITTTTTTVPSQFIPNSEFTLDANCIVSTATTPTAPASQQLAACVDVLCLPAYNDPCSISLVPVEETSLYSRLSTASFPTPASPHEQRICAASFGNRSHAKRMLATGSRDVICIWSVFPRSDGGIGYDAKQRHGFRTGGDEPCNNLVFDQDDRLLAACIGSDVLVFDVIAGVPLIVYTGHVAPVTAVQFFRPGPVSDGEPPEDVGPSTTWLISASEDRTFKVWDVENRSCLLQSTILSPHPFTTVAIGRGRVAFGSEDGTIRIYQIRPTETRLKCAYVCMRTIDFASIWRKKVVDFFPPNFASESPPKPDIVHSVHPMRRNHSEKAEVETPPSSDCESSNAIMGLAYFEHSASEDLSENGRCVNAPSALLVFVPSGIAVLDADSYEILHAHDFRKQPLRLVGEETPDLEFSVPFPGSFAFVSRPAPEAATVLVGSAFDNVVVVLRLATKVLKSADQAERDSIFSIPEYARLINNALLSEQNGVDALDKVLKALLQRHIRGAWLSNVYRDCMTRLAGLGIRRLRDLHGLPKDEDVLGLPFYLTEYLREIAQEQLEQEDMNRSGSTPSVEQRVLSLVPTEDEVIDPNSPLKSKFTLKPRPPTTPNCRITTKGSLPMDQPVTFRSRVSSSGYTTAPKMINTAKKNQKCVSVKRTVQNEDAAWERFGAEAKLDTVQTIKCHSSLVTGVRYSPNGQTIATSGHDNIVRSFRVPVRPKTPIKDFIGHNGTLHSVNWSASGQHIVTASSDHTARLWSVERSESLLVLNQMEGNTIRTANAESRNPTAIGQYKNEVRQAMFFYKDKFILVASGNQVLMYKYLLETSKTDTVRPNTNRNKYKLVTAVTSSPNAQMTTAVACVNSAFRSHMILTGTSGKSVHVHDMNSNRLVRTFTGHTRPPHAISLADYPTCQSSEATDLVLTAACTDSVRLWDLRVQRAVRVFDGHKNRYAPVGCALSPCSRYVAVGSECPNAYIYDLRQGTVIKRLGGHTDVVFDVTWNPCSAELATGCGDGKVRFFNIKK